MSFKHIVLPVDPKINDYAYEISQIMIEQGQICDCDERYAVGPNSKLREAETKDYDFIHMVGWIDLDVYYMSSRDNRIKKSLGRKKIIDFLHDIKCGKIH